MEEIEGYYVGDRIRSVEEFTFHKESKSGRPIGSEGVVKELLLAELFW